MTRTFIPSKFIVSKNLFNKIEKELNNLLKNWLKKEFISKKEYFSTRSSNSSLPKVAFPKIHKKNILFKITVFSVNIAHLHTYTYKKY